MSINHIKNIKEIDKAIDKKIAQNQKIVLVDPKQPLATEATGFNEFIEPIGLCYIASFLKKKWI